MSDENKLPVAADAQDTRTRKTVKLRSAAPITQDIPVSDPLTSRDTDTGNLEILDDTQTRKTLKLKPMSPGGASAGPKLNLGSSEDTNTRKTVLLRPSGGVKLPTVPGAADPARPAVPGGVSVPPPSVSAPANPVSVTSVTLPGVDVNDQTQAVPKPAAAAVKPVISAPGVDVDDQTQAVPKPAAAPAAPKVDLDDQTQAVPKPAAAPVKPAISAPGVDVDDQTRAVPKPVPAASGVQIPADAAADNDDQTVKLKRPPRMTPGMPAAPTPGAGPALRPPMGAGNNKATVKLAPITAATPAPAVPPAAAPKPAAPAPAPAPAAAPAAAPAPAPAPALATAPAPAAPKPAPAPAPATAALKPPVAATDSPQPAQSKEMPTLAVKVEEPSEAEAAAEAAPAFSIDANTAPVTENSPSLFYLIVAVLTFLCITVAGTLTTFHYLEFDQNIKCYDQVPGLPVAK